MDNNYFTITTNRDTAEQIKRMCDREKRFGDTRSFELHSISHETGYSVVYIKAKKEKIEPSDIFWLGYFSATS